MRSTRIRVTLMMAAAVTLAVAATSAKAAPITWEIQSASSWMRLNLPANTPIDLDGNAVTVRLRNASNGTLTDSTGIRAALDGTISTNYVDGSSIEFLSGNHGIVAVESGSYRPNPAAFDPGATNADNPNGQYTNTSGAPAAFATRVNVAALFGLVNVTGGWLALRDVTPDIASGVIPLGGGTTIAGSTTTIGAGAFADIDGQNIDLVGEQPIPDTLGEEFNLPGGVNTAAGSVTDIGGLMRQLSLTINVPVSIDLGEGIVINASVQGQIVAIAEVPEPSTFIMLGMGTAALGLTVYRRRMVRK